MRAIHGYNGHPVTALALKLAPLVFVRPGRAACGGMVEFDLANRGMAHSPAARMKMGELHIVPLSRQAPGDSGPELQPLARGGRYLFPSLRTRDRPNVRQHNQRGSAAHGIHKPGAAGHGFRTLASTLLNEQGFPPDVIELQLATRSATRSAPLQQSAAASRAAGDDAGMGRLIWTGYARAEP